MMTICTVKGQFLVYSVLQFKRFKFWPEMFSLYFAVFLPVVDSVIEFKQLKAIRTSTAPTLCFNVVFSVIEFYLHLNKLIL